MQPLLQILENVLLLSLLGLGFYAIESQRETISRRVADLLHGVSFGLIAFLVTTTFVPFADGATVDARAAPVILAGYVGGPIAAFIAAVLGGLARGMVGSHFVFSGVIVYFVYAVIGSAFWAARRDKPVDFRNAVHIGGMCLASCVGAAAMFVLIQPYERAIAWLMNDLPFIMAANVLGLIFAVGVLSIAAAVLQKTREVNELVETLQLAKRAGGFGIWDYDIRTGALNWDEQSLNLHGMDGTSFTGTFEDWARRVHPEDRITAQENFWHALQSADSYEVEYRVPHEDGTETTIKGNAIFLRDSEGDATRVVGTNLDLTTIRTAEKKLKEAQRLAFQAQKFETIGKMTGGVAHDFNNLLAVIMGNLELAADELRKDKPDREEVFTLFEASLEATRRGADLTQNMLAYARKARLSPERLDLNDTVRETENWMRRTIPSKIDIKTDLQPDLWLTRVDRISLQNALINLLVNARDAFEASGRILIETANVRVGDNVTLEDDEDIAPGRYVTLAVTDTGRGMEENVIQNMFDPFFTTKNVGEGSGLGLSMVEGFVKQSGGEIRVNSKPGFGTRMKVYFPALGSDTPTTPKTRLPEVQTVHAERPSGRILLVEDREDVLDVLHKALAGAGYEVATAKCGDEGFRIYQQDPQFDLVVTDIVMPGELQGPTLAQKIREDDPEMPFIFLSGYVSISAAHGYVPAQGDVRLMKPVSREELLANVARSLKK